MSYCLRPATWLLGAALLTGYGCSGTPSEDDLGDGPNAKPVPATYRVKLDTSEGDVIIEVTRDWSPHGADRFYKLVKIGFYDNCRFFRVLPGFMAQAGMNGDPKVMAKWDSANIKDDPANKSNLRGYVTFAKTGMPNSRSTQFFINYGDNSRLDPDGFTPFGRVVEGMGVVESFFSGYGEGPPQGNGPDQMQIKQSGNKYLNERFPQLDYIIKATILTDDAEKKTGNKTPKTSSSKSTEKTDGNAKKS